MTKRVAIPINVENHFKMFLSRAKKAFYVFKLILSVEHGGWEIYMYLLCSSDNPRLTIGLCLRQVKFDPLYRVQI